MLTWQLGQGGQNVRQSVVASLHQKGVVGEKHQDGEAGRNWEEQEEGSLVCGLSRCSWRDRWGT
jgi:hypothetical protein